MPHSPEAAVAGHEAQLGLHDQLAVAYHGLRAAVLERGAGRTEEKATALEASSAHYEELGDLAVRSVLKVENIGIEAMEKKVKDGTKPDVVSQLTPELARSRWQAKAVERKLSTDPMVDGDIDLSAGNHNAGFFAKRRESALLKRVNKLAVQQAGQKNLKSLAGDRNAGHVSYSRNALRTHQGKKAARQAYQDGTISMSEMKMRKQQAKYGRKPVTGEDGKTYWVNNTAYSKGYGDKHVSKRRWLNEAIVTKLAPDMSKHEEHMKRLDEKAEKRRAKAAAHREKAEARTRAA